MEVFHVFIWIIISKNSQLVRMKFDFKLRKTENYNRIISNADTIANIQDCQK